MSFFNYYLSIIKIQSTWKSYKSRRIINNILIKLPCDLQFIILNFIRFDWYVQFIYIPSIIKIYNNRLKLLWELYKSHRLRSMFHDYSFFNYNELQIIRYKIFQCETKLLQLKL